MPRRIIGCVQKTVEKQNNVAPKAKNFWLKAAFFFAVLPVYPLRIIRKIIIKRRNKGINITGFVKIGGVKQYLRIRGKDLAHPPKLRVPVRFIEAGRDAVTDSGLALELLGEIYATDKRAYLVKKAGHNVIFDKPGQLAELIAAAVEE